MRSVNGDGSGSVPVLSAVGAGVLGLGGEGDQVDPSDQRNLHGDAVGVRPVKEGVVPHAHVLPQRIRRGDHLRKTAVLSAAKYKRQKRRPISN